MRVLLATVVLLLAPAVAAQPDPLPENPYPMPPEVMQWAATDGTALELDDPETLAALRDVEGRISGQSIHDCIEEITNDVPNSYRVMGTPTQDMFLDKYDSVFSDLGLASARHEFTDGAPGVGGLTNDVEALQGGTNLLGVLPGNNLTEWIVIGGHYDTREFTMGGGALDNAAGICTVKELARAFKGHADEVGPLGSSVVFAWYDGEEWGLYGAIAFANDPSVAVQLLGLPEHTAPSIVVSQAYDMPGLNYPAKNNWVQYGEPDVIDEYAVLNLRTAPIHVEEEWTCWSYGCYEDLKVRDDFATILRRNANFQFLMREVAYDVLMLPPQYVWIYDDHYGRSDHIPLIGMGAAGNRIQGSHDGEYPHYHQPTDSLPGLYALTGGTPDGIVAGFQTEALAGGLTAFYVAKTGDFGAYGDKWFPQNGTAGLNGTDGADGSDVEGEDGANDVPLPPVLALAAVALALRMRRGRGNA